MVTQSLQIVGIVGGSCAGKTWLATRLESLFGGRAVRLSQDDFYLDRSHLSMAQRTRVNFDHPRAIDWDRMEEVLEQFKSGSSASVPRYDFKTHGRMPVETTVNPTGLVLVEGLWLFRRPAMRKLFNLKVFIRAPWDWRERKRLERDTGERGRTAEQVKEQLSRFTFPMHERFVAPQERWADEVLEGPVNEQDVQRLTRSIEMTLEGVGI